ncbi:N-acylethanolamine-hydrolyzing acid amidase-like [Branchiostoma floridae x Branchiostoma japonicum]
MEQIDKVLPMGRYPVDLDTEPEKRYDELFQKQEIQDLIPTLRQGVKDMMSVIPEEVRPLLVKLLAELDQCLPQPFAGEMRGIARCTGIDLGEIVGLNLGYDLSTFCTSIVAQDSKGTIWHGRNMDLVKEFAKTSEFLRSTAIMIDFQSKGQTLYTSTTYLGYVGAPTGQSPDKFTVSVNLRREYNSIGQQVYKTIKDLTRRKVNSVH